MSTPSLPPFRADVVGSYLRPSYLHEARQQVAEGTLSVAELTQVEDRAITELVSRQKQAGLHVITDGEFRRSWWHLDFMWHLGGVEKCDIAQGYAFAKLHTRAESARLTGPISGADHPFVEHFKFIQQFADEDHVARMTTPAPAQLLAELLRGPNKAITEQFYPDRAQLIADIAGAYRTYMHDLYAAGCRNLQFDDCTWGMLVDPKFANGAADEDNTATQCGCGAHHDTPHELQIAELAELYLTVNNAALAEAPDGLVVTSHVCRGNYRSTWASSGGYQPIADYLFARENVSAFYLEFDTERAGDFSPLAKLSADKKVVLGLVSSKVGELEDPEAIIARIKEASQYVPLERLCLSTQCGFASTEEGNELTEQQQWDKIALVHNIARRVWS